MLTARKITRIIKTMESQILAKKTNAYMGRKIKLIEHLLVVSLFA